MMAAGVRETGRRNIKKDLTNYFKFFLMTYFASQIGVNIYGSGLHVQNVPEAWRSYHWHVSGLK
jgi:hypothetical protein